MLLTGTLFQSSMKLFGLIILFVVIIVACYYVTRFIGLKSMGTIRESNIRLIDTYRINQNQCLLIVCVGKRYFLLASNKESVTLLSELGEDELFLVDAVENRSMKFQDVFSAVVKKQNVTKKSEDSDDKSE